MIMKTLRAERRDFGTITSTAGRRDVSSNTKSSGSGGVVENETNTINNTLTTTTTGLPTITTGVVEVEGSVGGGIGGGEGQCMTSPRWKARECEQNKVRLRDADGYRIRAAALVIKGSGDEKLVLLVSGGKDGAKWVIPGGGIEKDECAEEAAHRELMEEAGVRATTVKKVGTFQDDVRKHRTQVFLMEVAEELQTWEENEYGRQRIWMKVDESPEKVKQSHRPILEALLLLR